MFSMLNTSVVSSNVKPFYLRIRQQQIAAQCKGKRVVYTKTESAEEVLYDQRRKSLNLGNTIKRNRFQKSHSLDDYKVMERKLRNVTPLKKSNVDTAYKAKGDSSIIEDDNVSKKKFVKKIFRKPKNNDSKLEYSNDMTNALRMIFNIHDIIVDQDNTTEDSERKDNNTRKNSNDNKNKSATRKKSIEEEKFVIPELLLNGEKLEEVDEDFATIQEQPYSIDGDGLRFAIVEAENSFIIETVEKFDKRKLFLSISGPRQSAIRVDAKIISSNLCKITYWPKRTGIYVITVKWEDNHVIGTPFYVKAVSI